MKKLSIKWKAGVLIIFSSLLLIVSLFFVNKSELDNRVDRSHEINLLSAASKIQYFIKEQLNENKKHLTGDPNLDSLLESRFRELLPEMESLFNVQIFIESKTATAEASDFQIDKFVNGFHVLGQNEREITCHFTIEGFDFLADQKLSLSSNFNLLDTEGKYLISNIVLIIIVVAVITFFTIFIHRKLLTSRILRLNREVQQISSSKNFASKLTISGSDEIEQLKKEINGMLRALFYAFNQHKATEDRLSLLDEALKVAATSVLITDCDGYILWCNPAFEDLSLLSYKELIGQNYNILNIDKRDVVEEVLKQGTYWKGETNLGYRGEQITIQVELTPVLIDDQNITHYIFIIEDVTDRKKAETELILAKEEAEKSDQIKSEFLAQMSHEIRTPINAILNFLSLIKEEIFGKVTEDVKECFRMVDSGSNRLMRTIHLLIDMSMLQTNSFEITKRPVKIFEHIITPVIGIYSRYAADKSLNMEMSNEISEEPLINADIYSVTQIMMNLLDNSVKYTEEGRIDVIAKINDDSRLRIDIKDTGIGMTPDYLETLFKPFTQEEQGYQRRYEGNGLGLAVVNRMCELNDIEIKVESEKGKGSIFSLLFN